MRRGYIKWDKWLNEFDEGLGNLLIVGDKPLVEIVKA